MAEGPKATTSLWQRFDIAPAPTRAPESPKWPRMRSLALRQDEPASIETCAYYSFGEDGSSSFEAVACDGGCVTSGSLFGCSNLPTTCHDNTAAACYGTESAALTCCESDFPFCVTGIMTSNDEVFTAFRCGKDFLSGETDLYPDTARTSTATVDDGPTTVYVTTVHSPSTTSGVDQGTTPGDSEGSTSGGGSGGGRNTKALGAIVGGSIGGVALLLLVAFGIWFIRFQKRKATAAKASTEIYKRAELEGDYLTSHAYGSYTSNTSEPGGSGQLVDADVCSPLPVLVEAPDTSSQYRQSVAMTFASELPAQDK